VKNATRPAIFKWRQTAPELILCAVRWYLRYSLSLRDVEELFAERGLEADHTTIWRWVQRYGRTGTAAASSAQADEQILACR
jgi:IS6 family transposase